MKNSEVQLRSSKPKLRIIQGGGHPKLAEPTPNKDKSIYVVKMKPVHFMGQDNAMAFCRHLIELAEAYDVRPLPFYVQEGK